MCISTRLHTNLVQFDSQVVLFTKVRVLSLLHMIAVVRNRTELRRWCTGRQRFLVLHGLCLQGRNCRGGPLWPPLPDNGAFQEGAATEGRPYGTFITLMFCWLIVGMLSASAQQRKQINGKVTDPN